MSLIPVAFPYCRATYFEFRISIFDLPETLHHPWSPSCRWEISPDATESKLESVEMCGLWDYEAKSFSFFWPQPGVLSTRLILKSPKSAYTNGWHKKDIVRYFNLSVRTPCRVWPFRIILKFWSLLPTGGWDFLYPSSQLLAFHLRLSKNMMQPKFWTMGKEYFYSHECLLPHLPFFKILCTKVGVVDKKF